MLRHNPRKVSEKIIPPILLHNKWPLSNPIKEEGGEEDEHYLYEVDCDDLEELFVGGGNVGLLENARAVG